VLCYFKDHADINPSMGYIASKTHKGIKVCHCFGCGKTADVVRLHQIMCSQYLHKELSEREACEDLALKFNIPIAAFDELADDDFEGRYLRQIRSIDYLSTKYTHREFQQELLQARAKRTGLALDLDKVNAESVKMIATLKHLYD
jgi:DNA primase